MVEGSLHILRILLVALFLALLVFEGEPVAAQPMQAGVAIGPDHRYLVFEERLVELTNDGALKRLDLGLQVKAIMAPQGWTRSFLLQTDSGVYRAGLQPDGSLSVVALHPSPEARVEIWNQSALVTAPQEPYLLSISDDELHALPLTGPAELTILDQATGLARSEGRWFRLKQGLTVELESLPAKETHGFDRVSSGQDFALLWSQDNRAVVSLGWTAESILAEATLLPETPENGVRALEGGGGLAQGSERIHWLRPDGSSSSSPTPEGFSLGAAVPPDLFTYLGDLYCLYRDGETVKAWRWSEEGLLGQEIGSGELVSVVAPGPMSAPPWVLVATRRTEDDFDVAGRAIVELASGRSRRAQVTDLSLLGLSEDAGWEEMEQWPRTQLVGPVERFGDLILLALQREPEKGLGLRQDVDLRFPYPQVVLQGRQARDFSLRWEWAPERGASPSKGRLPDGTWPKTGPAGPIYFTSEDHRLVAFSPREGAALWYTPALALDDSSPLMLDWGDSLGLQLSKGPRDTLVRIDFQSGQIVAKTALNPFFLASRWPHLIGVLLICLALVYYIYAAGRRKLYIRRIAGLQALDEAVGRATEMGKPVLYVTGLADVDDIQTLAALSILSHVARKTAEYDTPVVATTSRAVVYSAAKEVVKDAFTIAGRPDAFSVESVRYISDDQFGYTAGVDGIMLREKPAANFYMGKFYAESLILAETGHATGAIQIAGTAEPSQLPFFVAACDYTLIGEELFAASAYLSRDPLQVGSLRGQDVGKAIVMLALLLGSLYVTLVGPLDGAFAP